MEETRQVEMVADITLRTIFRANQYREEDGTWESPESILEGCLVDGLKTFNKDKDPELLYREAQRMEIVSCTLAKGTK